MHRWGSFFNMMRSGATKSQAVLQTVLRAFFFVRPFQRNCPVNLPSVLAPEAVDTIRIHLEALSEIDLKLVYWFVSLLI